MPTILIINNTSHFRKSLIKFLQSEIEGLTFLEEPNGIMGLKRIEKLTPDLIITNYRMPAMDGLKFIKIFRKTNQKTPIIFVCYETAILKTAKEAGANFTLNAHDQLYGLNFINAIKTALSLP